MQFQLWLSQSNNKLLLKEAALLFCFQVPPSVPISLEMLTDLIRTFSCFVSFFIPQMDFSTPDLCCSCTIAVPDVKGGVAAFRAGRWGCADLPLFGSSSHTDFSAVWKVSLESRSRERNGWLQIFRGEKVIGSSCLVATEEEIAKGYEQPE